MNISSTKPTVNVLISFPFKVRDVVRDGEVWVEDSAKLERMTEAAEGAGRAVIAIWVIVTKLTTNEAFCNCSVFFPPEVTLPKM